MSSSKKDVAEDKLAELFQKYCKMIISGTEEQALVARRLIRDERDRLDRR
jgi:hypothetical protein